MNLSSDPHSHAHETCHNVLCHSLPAQNIPCILCYQQLAFYPPGTINLFPYLQLCFPLIWFISSQERTIVYKEHTCLIFFIHIYWKSKSNYYLPRTIIRFQERHNFGKKNNWYVAFSIYLECVCMCNIDKLFISSIFRQMNSTKIFETILESLFFHTLQSIH